MFGRDKHATSEGKVKPKREEQRKAQPDQTSKYPKGTVFYCKICGEDESEEYSSLEEVEAHKREAHGSVDSALEEQHKITLLFKFVDDNTMEVTCTESEADRIFDDLDNITKQWLILDDDAQTHLNKSNIISVEVE